MNYVETSTQAKILLQQKHHAQAVQTATSALEHLLIEPSKRLLRQTVSGCKKEPNDLVEAGVSVTRNSVKERSGCP